MSLGSSDRDFCFQKIDSAIALIDRMIDGDHPHRESVEALKQIRSVYFAERRLLELLPDTAASDTILEHCRRINIALVKFKNFLGFLLRSTNIRNAFELYFPIRTLASQLISPNAKVVLGSEWNFSPYTYPIALKELPDFIFIGIPASESQNPLVLPLAGHELGHVVWRRKGAKEHFDPIIRAGILASYRAHWSEFARLFNTSLPPEKLESDLFLRGIWGRSYALAQRQLEELFCDFIGLFIFGPSFLHSFRYLIAPSLGPTRSAHYPPIAKRARYLIEFASKCGISGFDDFTMAFSEKEPAPSPNDAFILKRADEVTVDLYSSLFDLVDKYRGTVSRFDDYLADIDEARISLEALVPAAATNSASAIVNAGWQVRVGRVPKHLRPGPSPPAKRWRGPSKAVEEGDRPLTPTKQKGAALATPFFDASPTSFSSVCPNDGQRRAPWDQHAAPPRATGRGSRPTFRPVFQLVVFVDIYPRTISGTPKVCVVRHQALHSLCIHCIRRLSWLDPKSLGRKTPPVARPAPQPT